MIPYSTISATTITSSLYKIHPFGRNVKQRTVCGEWDWLSKVRIVKDFSKVGLPEATDKTADNLIYCPKADFSFQEI